MFKSLIAAAAVALMATTVNAATFTFDTGDGNGFGLQTVDEPNQFQLYMLGSNNDIGGAFNDDTTFTAAAPATTTYAVDWSYETFDLGGPSFDPFGYFIGATKYFLSDDFGADFQNGTFLLSVALGESFGFFIDSGDDTSGAGSAFITGRKTTLPSAVPLPASGLLLLAGMGGLTLRSRKKAKQAAA